MFVVFLVMQYVSHEESNLMYQADCVYCLCVHTLGLMDIHVLKKHMN
jgi:hypothetical protein